MKTRILTYLINGIKEIDQMIALILPMTSSRDGTPFAAGHIPLRTYKGEVPVLFEN